MTRLHQFHAVCCSAYTLLCLTWRATAGHVPPWDFFHYHLYVAHAWWENRLPDELFAAGAQSYLNPLPHLPFYLAYLTGATSLFIAMSMALLHSINLWLLHFIACRLIAPTDRMRRLAVICSVLLGTLSPGFLFEVGTSYTDLIVSIPTLGALLLLLIYTPHTNPLDWRPLYAASLLAGFAVGLKPTALVFCAALLLALVLLSSCRAWSVAWRALLAGTTGLGLSGGAHAWMLWKAFDNPFFPLFNNFFHSPWFPPVKVVSERFRPASLEAALRFPLDMANSFKRISFEEQVVDIRPMWLLWLTICTILMLLVRHFRSTQPRKTLPNEQKFFWLCLALSIPGWIYSSGNIRYAIEPLLLLGPAIALLALHWIGKQHYCALLAIFLPLFGQTVLATTINAATLPGFNGKAWRPKLLDVSIPAPLNIVPTSYLSLQGLSFASYAPIMPTQSRFLNLISSTNLPPDAMLIKAEEAYRHTHKMPLRTLHLVQKEELQNHIWQTEVDKQNSTLSEYGYRIQENDCVLIELNLSNTASVKDTSSTNSKIGNKSRQVLISCSVIKTDSINPKEKTRREYIDARIDQWAQRCPDAFSPLGFWSVQRPHARQRFFPNTGVSIAEKGGALRAIYSDTNIPTIDLEDKDGSPLITGCPKKPSK